jgi:hypothetical protein
MLRTTPTRKKMTFTWHNLYLYCDEKDCAAAVAKTLRASLVASGYELYDPFGPMPGKAYLNRVPMFITPCIDSWIRVLSDTAIDVSLASSLSHLGLCLSLQLAGDAASVEIYSNGTMADPLIALAPHLNTACTIDDLHHALNDEFRHSLESRPTVSGAVPLNVLPDDVKALADDLSLKQVDIFFNRIMSKVGARVAGNPRAARELLTQVRPDWDSPGGQRIRALMKCLTIPDPYWHEPDFVTLRDAYQLHSRRKRNPDALLYPGDDNALNAVPDALDYMPIYGGMTT